MCWLPLFISILAVKSDCTEIHIVEFYGKIGWASSSYMTGTIVGEPERVCADDCFMNPLCMAYVGSIGDCTFFPLTNKQYLNTTNLGVGEKEVLGIKTILPGDTCPANYTDVHFKMVSPEGEVFPWKLRTNGLWVFKICWEGWKRFERSDNRVVCMKLVNKTSVTRSDLNEVCYYDIAPYYAKLAGVHSVEESVWMRDEAAKYTSSGSEPLNYWTSGARDGTCEGTDPYEKKINFKWNDELTTGSAALTEENSELSCKDEGVAKNCLVVRSQGPSTPQIFGDFDCESTVSIGGGFCIYDLWQGIE